MKIKNLKIYLLFAGVFVLSLLNAQTDSFRDSSQTRFPISKIGSDPYMPDKSSAIDLKDPDNYTQETEYDVETGNYILRNKIGDIEVGTPTLMSFDEYKKYNMQQSLNAFWAQKTDEERQKNGKGGIFDINIGLGKASAIFGEGGIQIKPQGYAELSFGIKTNKIDNPHLAERLRKTTVFDFDEKIVMSLAGSVGDRIKLNMDYNTEATFDFDNTINLNFEGKEDDIVQKVEAGNVSLPLSGSLIRGSQSLFGFKTELQFGRLSVATVFSQQESETESMTLKGGASSSEYEIKADEYDANRHFYLTHFFKENYDKWMKNLPVIVSGVTINRVEVWVTNKRGNFEEARNIVGFMDLAEPDEIDNPEWVKTTGANYPNNDANSLYNEMSTRYSGVRDISKVTETLSPLNSKGFVGGEDYEKIENARLLSSNEYYVNRNLGYISLKSSLNADEVLAVAFEYTFQGRAYKVGEFSTDSIVPPKSLVLKLLKGTNLTPELKTWDLMMKNIYSLGAYRVNNEDFKFDIVYMDDSAGVELSYIPVGKISEKRLLNVMNLDNLNSNNERGPDGLFDWVEGYTMLSDNGKIIFPVREPFGVDYLYKQIGIADSSVAKSYAFEELYRNTLTIAQQTAEKNKFRMKGDYKSASGSEIKLNAINIPRGSVKVTAGGRTLTENVDYTVDYASGYLKILNQPLLESGTAIQVSMENQALFSLQKKTMIGTHLNYRVNDDIQFGGTLMHLYERPLTQKVTMGEDPISNTIWGLNAAFKKEVPFITKMVDKLPFIDTKAPSSVTVSAEMAQLIPGHSSVIGGGGSAYLDDFEATKIGIDIRHFFSWKLASVPQEFDEASLSNDLEYGMNRSKIAWYQIDRMFQEESSLMPNHLKNDAEARSNHYVRSVNQRNLFPNKDNAYGESTLIPVLNVSYYPEERGPYNYSTEPIDPLTGYFENPKDKWGGIMRKIETNDFEQANIEYMEFWVMDPFIYDDANDPNVGGELVFNLGNISEDILKDGRKAFENGLPIGSDKTDVEETVWGYVAKKQSMVPAFDNNADSRKYQDVGLDGMSDEEEASFPSLNAYMQTLGTYATNDNIRKLTEDPSQDNYHYFRGSDYDRDEVSILDRYKNYNNMEGNSPVDNQSQETYPTTGSTRPDVEDINQDNTLSENESYYIYKVNLKPQEMEVGLNYITDTRMETKKLPNNETDSVKWYQFKIPVHNPDSVYGSINDFKSIRFVRMYMSKFQQPVHLRFASFELVRGEWRRYSQPLIVNTYSPEGILDIGAVNIEENSDRSPVNYILPPEVSRVIDPGQPQLRELNEQAMVLKAKKLAPGDARAAYKTLEMDLRQFRRIQMWVHAEALTGDVEGWTDLDDGDMSVFIRMGSDYKNNYYEYEIPLKLTPHFNHYDDTKEADRYAVWPKENSFDFPLELLTELKLKRNREKRQSTSQVTFANEYSQIVSDKPEHRITVKGNPSLSSVRTIMIGVRNKRQRSGEIRSAEVWVNELRLTDFDEDGGWAGIASASIQLADLGRVNLAGSFSTAGFGGLEQKLMERQLDDLSNFDVSTNLQLGKFFPEKAQVSLPVYYAYSQDRISPKYNPLDQDILLQDAIDNAESQTVKDSIKAVAQDLTTRKSFSVSNVRVGYGGEKKQFFDVNNFGANYSYNETLRQNPTTTHDLSKQYRGGLTYNYSFSAKPLEPFRKLKFLENPHLALIRDFNIYYLPEQIGFKTDMNRNYSELKLRDISNSGFEIPTSVRKDWYWNTVFDFRYKLANSLSMDFSAQTNAIIDEPYYTKDKDGNNTESVLILNRELYASDYQMWKDEVNSNLRSWGRAALYSQKFNARYDVPLSKFPLLNWITADGTYNATYNWEMGPEPFEGENNDTIQLGNVIRNNRTIQVNGQLNFAGLYNKSPYLKEVHSKYGRARGRRSAKRFKTAKFEKKYAFEKGKMVVINHKLGSDKPNIRIYGEKSRQLTGDRNIVDDNTLEFTPSADAASGRVVITARVEDKETLAQQILGRTVRVLMGVKSLSGNYTQGNEFVLPGFSPDNLNLVGQDNGAPGWQFAFGSQDLGLIKRAHENRWLATSPQLNQAYILTDRRQASAQASIEPINGLKITFDANWTHNKSSSAFYLYEEGNYNQFNNATNQVDAGNFSMTWLGIKTSFKGIEKDARYTSEVFDNFKNNRSIISRRNQNDNALSSDVNSADVLVPAFLAAYSGNDASTSSTNKFPSILNVLPNWRIRYDGLSKIPALKKYFKSVNINHSYRATYNVSGFNTNLSTGRIDVPSINITEAFSPLINLDMAFKNSFTSRFEIRKTRNVNLNISSNQVVEMMSNEYILGLGYRFNNFNLILNSGGRSRNISNDLTLRADLSIRDLKTIIRKIEEDYNQPSSGQNAVSIKTTADYTLSKSVTIQLYYDRMMVSPLISTSYNTMNSNFGISFKFQLTQ